MGLRPFSCLYACEVAKDRFRVLTRCPGVRGGFCAALWGCCLWHLPAPFYGTGPPAGPAPALVNALRKTAFMGMGVTELWRNQGGLAGHVVHHRDARTGIAVHRGKGCVEAGKPDAVCHQPCRIKPPG